MSSTTSIDADEQMAVELAGHRAAAEISRLWRRLAAPDPTPTTFAPSLVANLPEPARRWLTHAIAPGRPIARAAVLQMRGHIRIGRWLPFQAIQLHAPPAGYLWIAKAGRGPVSIRGYDRYTDGTGQMRWRLFGRVPLINAAGRDLDRSAAGRVALDAFTVPTSWIEPSIRWRPGADADSAVAEWTVGGHTLRPEIRVGPDGTLRSVTMPRWASPNGAPWGEYPCGGSLDHEAEFDGITMPTRMRAGYFFGTDRWAEGEFFRATITDAHFV